MTSLIRLNVGGSLFITTKETLCLKDSLFEKMFNGNMKPGHTLHDTQGNEVIFIDRSGALFEYILQYLREPESWELPSDMGVIKNIRTEALYYGLDDLIKSIDQAMKCEIPEVKLPVEFEVFHLRITSTRSLCYGDIMASPAKVQSKLTAVNNPTTIQEIIQTCRPWYRCASVTESHISGDPFYYLVFETDITVCSLFLK